MKLSTVLILVAVLYVTTLFFPQLESWLNAATAILLLGKALAFNASMVQHNNRHYHNKNKGAY